MAGRILTIQRQARELGRLRTGYTDTSGDKPRPVRSDTWIVTSPAEHYVEAAAAEWGGKVEKWQPLGAGAQQWRVITQAVAIDAIMPPGDPLSQSYESWSRGGCARRCDGITEQLSDGPCICQAQYGEEWWQQPKDKVCAATTRLNLILPQMPDVGVWRMETHSHWAANEIAAHVDLIRSATHGEHAVPVRVRIEQRQRVAGGKTKKFPVVAVELRGVTAGQVLASTLLGSISARTAAPALGGPAAAIESAPTGSKPRLSEEDQAKVIEGLPGMSAVDEVRALYRALVADYSLLKTDPVLVALNARAQELGAAADAGDPDALWQKVLATVPPDWSTSEVEAQFQKLTGVEAGKATAADMRRYLQAVVS